MSSIKLQDRVISFGGAIIFIVCLIILISTDKIIFQDVMGKIKAIVFISMYVIFALMSDELNSIIDIITHTWSILQREDAPEIKMTLIKQSLDLYIQRWNSIWQQLQHEKTRQVIKDRVIQLFKRIPNGCITFAQIIWIMAFTGYTFASSSVMFSATLAPFDGYVILAFYVVLMLTAGKMKGMGDLIKKIYGDVKVMKDGQTAVSILRDIENSIEALCGHFYLLQGKTKESKPLEGAA